MKVLAIHTQHNATCAFMDNGNIECVVSEEKFSNIKNDSSFPKQSILYIKKSYNVDCFDYVIICAEQCKIDLHGGRNPAVSIKPNFFKSLVTKNPENISPNGPKEAIEPIKNSE